MKKVLAVFLALSMAVSMGTVAMAESGTAVGYNPEDVYAVQNIISRNWIGTKPSESLFGWDFVEWSEPDEINFRYITKLDLSNRVKGDLTLSGFNTLTKLRSLDVSGCTELESLITPSNDALDTLNVSGCTSMVALYIDNSRLTSLDLSTLTNLEDLSFTNVPTLKDLDLDANRKLKKIDGSMNESKTIHIAEYPELEYVDFTSRTLESVTLYKCPKLKTVICNQLGNDDRPMVYGQLKELTIDECPSLTTLYCLKNRLTTLDLSGLSSLESLICGQNKLTTLDLTGCTSLKQLNCDNNKLTSLDVTDCTSLTGMDCSHNYLTKDAVKGFTGEWTVGEELYTSFYFDPQDDPSKPSKPSKPNLPDLPSLPDLPDISWPSLDKVIDDIKSDSNTEAQEAAVDIINDANAGTARAGKVQTVTTAAGASVPAVPVKLYGLNASLSLDTMETIAAGKTGLNVKLDNGAAEVLIPPAFTMPENSGYLAYSLGFQKDPLYTNLMKAAVKGDSAKTEVYKLGGGTLPTTATVTIKTKLTGKVNIYYWNEDTRKASLIASPTAENGKVTFAAKQLGNLILTTGTI